MEEQLAEYRARKAKEKKQSESKTWTSVLFDNVYMRRRRHEGMTTTETADDLHRQVQISDTTASESSENKPEQNISAHYRDYLTESIPLTRQEKVIYAVKLSLKIVLWVILWALFIEIGFGAVYFILSTFILIYWTMRSGTRDRSKLSAYSVFNPNFERLDGTFTAEQFEKELRYGAGSVR